jgi:hypothetical protein
VGTRKCLEGAKIWSWVPTGPETKNDCASEDGEQFTGLDWYPLAFPNTSWSRWAISFFAFVKYKRKMGDWRKVHDGFHYLCSTPNVFRMVRSKRIRYVRHVAHMGENINAYKAWWANLTEGIH